MIVNTTGNPGSVIVPQYGSSKITVFVWGKHTILKFVGNTKCKSMKLTLQLVVVVLISYRAQASFSWPRVDLARLLRPAYSLSFWITSFDFVKVCGIRFSTWESFIGFYICYYPITTILTCFFFVGVRISWKKLC